MSRWSFKINAKKNVETIVKIHVQLEVNVKINAKKNVETSGDNCKDPCWARGKCKHPCKDPCRDKCKDPCQGETKEKDECKEKFGYVRYYFFCQKFIFYQIIVRSVHLLRLRISRQRRQDSCWYVLDLRVAQSGLFQNRFWVWPRDQKEKKTI